MQDIRNFFKKVPEKAGGAKAGTLRTAAPSLLKCIQEAMAVLSEASEK